MNDTTDATCVFISSEMYDIVITSGRMFCRHKSVSGTSVEDGLPDLVPV